MDALNELLTQVTHALGGILAAAIVAVAVQLLRRLNISIDADRKAKLEYVVRQAVLAVEERAAALAKQHGAAVIMTANEKAQAALEAVVERIHNVDVDEARQVIQAVLPQLGIGATAGVRELGKAMRTPETR